MKKNIITNKITPCCLLPFSQMYFWIENLTLNSESDRQFIISKLSQSGNLHVDGWKVLINSGVLEADAALTKPEFLGWFDCKRPPSCEQLKLIIEGFKMGNYNPADEYGVGWTEISDFEEDGERIIKKVINYVGGIGDLPNELNDNINKYYAASGGFTSNKNLATDFKPNDLLLDVDGGALSFLVGKGINPIPTSTTQVWVKKNPPLVSGYYTYNNNTNTVAEVSGNTFMKTSFTANAGERIRVKIGNFYIQNNANGINPICIYIKNTAGDVIYYSKGMNETGIPEPAIGGSPATGTFEFERDIHVNSTIYVCGDYSTPILDIYVRENVTTGDSYVLNTSKADKLGGYLKYDTFLASNSQLTNPYKNKKQGILGDSLSEDPPSGQAPTTSKYWYTFMQEQIQLNFKTYALSGNTWADMYNQAVQAKADSVAGTQIFHLFTLFGGTNDFYFNVPIGEFYTTSGGVRTLNMDASTFKGRINRLLDYLKRNFPKIPINMFNILHRGAAHGTPSELTANGIGVFLDEYSKAIDEAGKLWAVPVIDIRGESGLYPVVPEALEFYTSSNDYLHLSALGHDKLNKYYQAKLFGLPI